MPTLYEYQCKKCKHKFEKIQKFSDRPIKKCPKCGSPVEKVMHAPAVQFKGTGWYVTDWRQRRQDRKVQGRKAAPIKQVQRKKKPPRKRSSEKSKDKDSSSKKSESKKSESKKSKD